MPDRFEKTGLLTARAGMGQGYSIEIQRSFGCRLSLPFRRWHVISFYPYAARVHRTGSAHDYLNNQDASHVGVYPAGAGEEIDWIGATEALHVHIDPETVIDETGQVVSPPRQDVSEDMTLTACLAALYEEVQGRAGETAARCERLIDSIWVRIAATGRPVASLRAPRLGRSNLSTLLNSMHGPVAAHTSIGDLAMMTGLSLAEFSRAFRKAFGSSPHDYLLTSRVELAKHAIYRGQSSLAEISLDCGFYDQAHLTNTFRKRTKMSPTGYVRWFGR